MSTKVRVLKPFSTVLKGEIVNIEDSNLDYLVSKKLVEVIGGSTKESEKSENSNEPQSNNGEQKSSNLLTIQQQNDYLETSDLLQPFIQQEETVSSCVQRLINASTSLAQNKENTDRYISELEKENETLKGQLEVSLSKASETDQPNLNLSPENNGETENKSGIGTGEAVPQVEAVSFESFLRKNLGSNVVEPLVSAGYETVVDFESATDTQLDEVENVGPATIIRLRELVSQYKAQTP
jgi:predicted RNase H-like nuclease (RuvC/YqgF family)